MRTRTFYLLSTVFLLFFASAYLSKNYLVDLFVKYSFQRYCKETLHINLEQADFLRQGESWVFKQISATRNSKEKILVADELQLSYSLDLFHLQQQFHLSVKNPKIHVCQLLKKSPHKKKNSWFPSAKKLLLETVTTLKVTGGQIYLNSFDEHPHFAFDTDGQAVPQVNIKGRFWSLQDSTKTSDFTLSVGGENRDLMISCSGDGLNVISGFLPKPLNTIFKDNSSLHTKVTFAKNKVLLATLLNEKQEINFDLQFENSVEHGFAFKEGRFSAANVPIEKYLPQIAKLPKVKMTGSSLVEGSFNSDSVILSYQVKDFCLNHPLGTLKIPATEQRGIHYIDLSSGRHGGNFSFKDASFINDSTGLSIDHLDALLLLDQEGGFCPSFHCFCHQLYLGGQCHISRWETIEIEANAFKGSTAQVRELLSQLKMDSSMQIPLEGTLAARQDGMRLSIALHPERVSFEGYLKGTFSEGSMQSTQWPIALDDLSFDFDLDLPSGRAVLSNIKGVLNKLKGPWQGSYRFAGDAIRINRAEPLLGDFDLWLGDKYGDFLRLAGHVESEDISNTQLQVQLDHHKTHLWDIFPTNCSFSLKNFFSVEKIDCDADFSCEALTKSIDKFHQQGKFPSALLNQMSVLKNGAGTFKLNLQYLSSDDCLNCKIKGKDIAFDHHRFQNCLLQVQKKDHTWKIEQFELDGLSLAAELSMQKNQELKLRFLGARLGSSMIGLEGTYQLSDEKFNGKINLLELQLEDCLQANALSAMPSSLGLKGKLSGKGEIQIENKSDQLKLSADLLASLTHWHVKGIPLDPCQFRLSLDPDCLAIHDLKSSFSTNSKELKGDFHLSKLEWDRSKSEINIHQLLFTVHPKSLLKIAESFKNFHFSSLLQQLPPKNSCEGSFSYQGSLQQGIAHLEFKENDYRFLNQDLHCKDLLITMDPKEYKLSTVLLQEETPIHVDIQSTSPFLTGEIVLSDSSEKASDGLKIKWNKNADQYPLEKIEGHCAGMTAKLRYNPNEEALQGTVHCELEKAKLWLPTVLSNKIKEWNIQGTLLCNGKWKPSLEAFRGHDQLLFNGTIEGTGLKAADFKFGSFHSSVTGDCLQPASLTMQGAANFNRISKQGKFTLLFPKEKVEKFCMHQEACNPIEGNMSFNFENSKLVLTELNMYSLGKLSRFHLHKDSLSYVDLDGNLNLSLSMKQNSLLYKIAEQYLLSIQGTVAKPEFSFVKQDSKK